MPTTPVSEQQTLEAKPDYLERYSVKITFDWITENSTQAGGYKRKQVESIGIGWPLVSGWKHKAVGRQINDDQKKLFESFAGSKDRNRVVGANYKLSGDCAECCEPWEVCTWPCPDAVTV